MSQVCHVAPAPTMLGRLSLLGVGRDIEERPIVWPGRCRVFVIGPLRPVQTRSGASDGAGRLPRDTRAAGGGADGDRSRGLAGAPLSLVPRDDLGPAVQSRGRLAPALRPCAACRLP